MPLKSLGRPTVLSEFELQRIREAIHQRRTPAFNRHEWQAYFRYLLGRDVTMQETIEALEAPK